jgi:hypothetical protein
MAADPSLRLAMPGTIRPLRFDGMVDYRISNQMKKINSSTLRKKIK